MERIGAHTFWGLRFGQPPKRFQRPVAAGGWEGIYDATTPKAQPLQGPYAFFYGPEPAGGYSEDCLFLNIHVPATPSIKPRPVLFWIYGGGGTGGSANQYDGSALAATADAVVVCINYRLGVFGLLDLSELGGPYFDSGNNWIADQLLALQWVRDNIADYGGDPDCVTVMGESQGAMATLNLCAIPAARGLVHRAMAFSGHCAPMAPIADTPALFARLRKTSRRDVIDFLLQAPAQDVLKLQLRAQYRGMRLGCPPEPGRLLPAPVADLIAQRGADAVPLVMGYQPNEGKFLAAFIDHYKQRGLKREFLLRAAAIGYGAVAAGGDSVWRYLLRQHRQKPIWSAYAMADAAVTDVFRRGSIIFALATRQAGAKAFRFVLDATPGSLGGIDVGSTHCTDLAFTFNWYADPQPSMTPICTSPAAPALAQRWAKMVGQFARTGDPSGPLGDWPAYDAQRRATLMVGLDAIRVVDDPERQHRLRVWREGA